MVHQGCWISNHNLVKTNDWGWKKEENRARWKSWYFSGWSRGREIVREVAEVEVGKVEEIRKEVSVRPKNRVEGSKTGNGM